jgi:hypothetical protein
MSTENLTATQLIDEHIASFNDWRGEMAAHFRTFIREAAPELSEEWKWTTPIFTYKGNVVGVGVFKDHLKLNFFQGAALDDPHGLFNAGLEAKTTRGIDLHEGDTIDEAALRALVQTAVAYNANKKKK